MKNDLINGRTQEEIKTALKVCNEDDCPSCPYEIGYMCSDYMMRDALALIERLEAQQPKWISVEERLPECYKAVLMLFPDNWVAVAIRANTNVYYDGKSEPLDSVTHWMPLPEPPKGEKK